MPSNPQPNPLVCQCPYNTYRRIPHPPAITLVNVSLRTPETNNHTHLSRSLPGIIEITNNKRVKSIQSRALPTDRINKKHKNTLDEVKSGNLWFPRSIKPIIRFDSCVTFAPIKVVKNYENELQNILSLMAVPVSGVKPRLRIWSDSSPP